MVSTTGDPFTAGSFVSVELSGRIDGQITYDSPSIPGLFAAVSLDFTDGNNAFSFANLATEADGTFFGTSDLTGATAFEMITTGGQSVSVFTLDNAEFSLVTQIDLAEGETRLDASVFFNSDMAAGFDNFRGDNVETTFTAGIVFDFGGGTIELTSIRSLTEGIAISSPVPEPSVAFLMVMGLMGLAGTKRMPTDR